MGELVVSITGDKSRCPFCHDTLAGETFTCSSCQTTHHRKCWDEYGGCTLLGCAGNTDDRSAVVEKISTNPRMLVWVEGPPGCFSAPAPDPDDEWDNSPTALPRERQEFNRRVARSYLTGEDFRQPRPSVPRIKQPLRVWRIILYTIATFGVTVTAFKIVGYPFEFYPLWVTMLMMALFQSSLLLVLVLYGIYCQRKRSGSD